MRPWHVLQPTPTARCALWLKYECSGSLWTFTQATGCPVSQLSRTGASLALSVRMVAWQPMQVWVLGSMACAAFSTLAWQ